MLTVSLHGIKIHAPIGLYSQEHILGNDFEIDVDIWLPVSEGQPLPFADYTLINKIVTDIFKQPGTLLEHYVQQIYNALKEQIAGTKKIRVAVRKLHPPLNGDVQYAQVILELGNSEI